VLGALALVDDPPGPQPDLVLVGELPGLDLGGDLPEVCFGGPQQVLALAGAFFGQDRVAAGPPGTGPVTGRLRLLFP
jgi:hypothetical protein